MKEFDFYVEKETLITYLRYYSCNPNAEYEPYDINWVFTLFLTCLDNLLSITSESEFMNLAYLLSDAQKEFIKNLVK